MVSLEGLGVERDDRALRLDLSYCCVLSEGAISAILSEREGRPFTGAAGVQRVLPGGWGGM